jgi:hyperosmotically inducible periplasmic protein
MPSRKHRLPLAVQNLLPNKRPPLRAHANYSCQALRANMNTKLLTLAFISLIGATALAADTPKPDADNTRKNAPDKTGEKANPIDQSNNPADLKITQAVRQAIVKDKSLTLTAKNVKIITANGNVVLRGPVNSAEEKAKIETAAKAAAGDAAKVDNQLEIKAQ